MGTMILEHQASYRTSSHGGPERIQLSVLDVLGLACVRRALWRQQVTVMLQRSMRVQVKGKISK
jgi:hypothetical protein